MTKLYFRKKYFSKNQERERVISLEIENHRDTSRECGTIGEDLSGLSFPHA